jgi:hypothetical protein
MTKTRSSRRGAPAGIRESLGGLLLLAIWLVAETLVRLDGLVAWAGEAAAGARAGAWR